MNSLSFNEVKYQIQTISTTNINYVRRFLFSVVNHKTPLDIALILPPSFIRDLFAWNGIIHSLEMTDLDDIGFELSDNGDQSADIRESCPSPPPPFHRHAIEQNIIVKPPITFIDQEPAISMKHIVPFDNIFFNDAKKYLFETATNGSSVLNEATKKPTNSLFQRFINFFRFSMISHNDLEFNHQCQQLLTLTKYPCDMSDRIHIRILYTIYRRLTNSKEIFYNSLGPHWEEIGFQTSNPETDFRSTGLFSIFFLLYFVDSMYLPLAKQIYQFSHDEIQQFPFCCIGINLANMLIKYLRHTRTNLRKLINENTAIDLIGKLFIALYLNFYLKWKHNAYTIEHTQQVLNELEKILINRPRILFQEFDDYFRKRQERRSQQYEFKQTNDNLI